MNFSKSGTETYRMFRDNHIKYNAFCLFSPPFLFKLETNLFNPVGSIDLISSESVSPLLCASSWRQNVPTQSDLGTNTITSRLKYFHCTE